MLIQKKLNAYAGNKPLKDTGYPSKTTKISSKPKNTVVKYVGQECKRTSIYQ